MVDLECNLRSAEGVPPALFHDAGTTKIDQDTSSIWAEDNVFIFDISVNCVVRVQELTIEQSLCVLTYTVSMKET